MATRAHDSGGFHPNPGDQPEPTPQTSPGVQQAGPPRTQAELDAYMRRFPRPQRDTYDGMFPLHEDMELSDEQVEIVRAYLREVDFHLPGATCEEFLIVRWARYVGFQFLSEDLEAYAIGLRCTHPGMEDQHTFIRMSWGQLMGHADAPRLPVNEPVLASDTMTLARYRDTRTGPSRTGVDAYTATAGQGEPGVDFDLTLLNGALAEVLTHHATGQGRELDHWWTPALDWGVALAGRYPRLKYFEAKGRLSPEQLTALRSFEQAAAEAEPVLIDLGLATIGPVAADAIEQFTRAEKGTFRSRLRIRNPIPLPDAPRANISAPVGAGAEAVDERPHSEDPAAFERQIAPDQRSAGDGTR